VGGDRCTVGASNNRGGGWGSCRVWLCTVERDDGGNSSVFLYTMCNDDGSSYTASIPSSAVGTPVAEIEVCNLPLSFGTPDIWRNVHIK